MSNMDTAEIERKLKSLFISQPQIGVVYLYGSQARGKADSRSDYDFAVYFDEPDIVKRNDLRFVLLSEISKALGTDAVDVESISDLQMPELKYTIIREGKVIFEREPYRVLLEPRILNEYFDFVYFLRKYHLTRA